MKKYKEGDFNILEAEPGNVLLCVTDGLVLGSKLILGINDSEIHYKEIPEPKENVEPPNVSADV